MRQISAVLAVVLLGSVSSGAKALDNVEAAIIKCRTSANTTMEQVKCLEDTLRIMVESTGEVDWANTDTIGVNTRTAPTSPSSTVQGIGSEQVQTQQQDFRSYQTEVQEQSTVADFAYNQNSRLVLVLSNGQVWKQRTGDSNYVRLKKGDTPRVLVRPGAISGYRMEFLDMNETIIVTRLQ